MKGDESVIVGPTATHPLMNSLVTAVERLDREPMVDGRVVRNARPCTICGAPSDRYDFGFQCQANPAHVGDPTVGIFDDLSCPMKTNG